MNNIIRVWDPLVRVFHWALVLAFITAYLSGDEESSVHVYSGYIVAGLVTFRIVWGLIGTRHARFSNFIYSPRTVAGYLKGLLTGTQRHYTGHNPAGGWMVLAMLLTLTVVSVSGLKIYAIEEGLGPLAGSAPYVTFLGIAHADSDDDEGHGRYREHDDEHDDDAEDFWEDLHEGSANFMLLLIALHITGVLVSSILHRENLVRAMVTGRKYVKAEE